MSEGIFKGECERERFRMFEVKEKLESVKVDRNFLLGQLGL